MIIPAGTRSRSIGNVATDFMLLFGIAYLQIMKPDGLFSCVDLTGFQLAVDKFGEYIYNY